MIVDVLALGFGLAFLLHLAFFWDAPRQWRRARRGALVIPSRLYHVANGAILAIMGAAALYEMLQDGPSLDAEVLRGDAVRGVVAGLALVGLVLAVAAKIALGPWFAPTGAVFPGQSVVMRGPYRFLHHPMYVGWWTFFVCWALVLDSAVFLAAALLVAPLLVVLARLERSFLVAHG